jgi:transcriptional regulator
MYTPKAFKIEEPGKVRAFIRSNGFGILITTNHDQIDSTHTPMYLSEDLKFVYGHIAKANPQWHTWMDNPMARVIFHGPHTYVSPSDYLSSFNVPTWNYTAISIDGTVETIAQLVNKQRVIEQLVNQYESSMENPWCLNTSDSKVMGLLDAIVCFRVKVDRICAKLKINQNKSMEDRCHVIGRLRKRGGEMNIAIADLMEHGLHNAEQVVAADADRRRR